MSKFTQAAKKCLSGSPVLEGRTKLELDTVMSRYPEGVTVDEFDILAGEKGPYPVFHIKDTDNYFNGGALAMKVVEGWVAMYEGDVSKASEELKKEGGCTFKLTHGRTRKGNPIIVYSVVE